MRRPRNKLSGLKAKENTFIGDIGGANGVWQRKKAKKGKKGRKRLQRSPTYQNILHHQRHFPFPASNCHPPKYPAISLLFFYCPYHFPAGY
ncbi:hypothetical protein FNH25_04280 [Morganella morganii]|nr:hypothetical protein [Morganella morganii]